MSGRLRLAIAAACVLAGACWAASPAAAQIDVTCSAPTATSCSGQWHRAAVAIDWRVVPPFVARSGWCIDEVINRDTRGALRGCEAVTSDGDEASRTVNIRVDRTAPSITGVAAARPADATGWYRTAVGVTFSGTDVTSGIGSCTKTTYAGPDTAAGTVAGECRDKAGNVSRSSFRLRFDATPPAVTAIAAARPPDHAGWYTAPVAFTVGGTDAMSGLAGCDPLAYGGPDSAAGVLTGTCRDVAGNVGSRAFAVPFDATAPKLTAVRVRPADGVVRLAWGATGADTMVVSRSLARGGRPTVVHHGPGTALVDRSVRSGRRYRYRLEAADAAGNTATRSLEVVPGPRLLAPAPGATVDRAPLLRWTRVRGARYYNVQLRREGRKVLSAWPTRNRLQLRRRWRFHGVQRLEPGRYRWRVWPGRGRRAEGDYGPLVGRRGFTVLP